MPSKRPVTAIYALQVLAPDLRLPGFVFKSRERAERGVLAGGADDHRVADLVEGGARVLGKAHADGVGAVVHDDRRGGGFALQDGAGVELDFLRREAGARGHNGIDAS